jgi:23S rRNA pseudouridine1911/1915/1917 synthase
VPSCKGKTQNSCFELVAKDYPKIAEVKGKNQNDGGLLHRLDTETAGILLFAKTQDFYDIVNQEQVENRFLKTYTAYCGSFCEIDSDLEGKTISSYFRSFGEKGSSVKPIFNLEEESRANKKKCGNKLYTTKILSVMDFAKSENMKLLKIKCQITNGFRHQVRSHLASQGLPVFGDKIYNPTFPAEKMLFFASEISFLQENYKLEDSYLDEIASKIFLASATK